MGNINQELVNEFKTKAGLVSAVVVEAKDIAGALEYVVETCASKPACEMLAEEEGAEKGPLGPNGVPTRVKRIVAAPCLDDNDFAKLSADCEAKGFSCLREGLRNHLAGIDVGFAIADYGVADSGTCMMNTDSEESRLAGMISETNIIALKKSCIKHKLQDIATDLRARMGSDSTPTYTTLITGPSRTADIERVSAVGVHGPLELHIVLLEA